ncbi:MAG: hypothetical protein QOH93_2597 [Chloroflexia bacterium]|jgi:hypothetical protein|nr:hypothetical protein [Chloroflexia bacterium]
MYAAVSVWSRDKDRAEEQLKVLHERIVPNVQRSPGFVAGYWTIDPVSNKNHVMIVFETEENARDFKAGIEQQRAIQAAGGMTLETMTITEVLASAQR